MVTKTMSAERLWRRVPLLPRKPLQGVRRSLVFRSLSLASLFVRCQSSISVYYLSCFSFSRLNPAIVGKPKPIGLSLSWEMGYFQSKAWDGTASMAGEPSNQGSFWTELS